MSTLDMPRGDALKESKNVQQPFGKVNYWDLPGKQGRGVRATILMDVAREGVKMGIAIDGSASMEPLFGRKPLGAFLPPPPNNVKPAAQAMSAYLASKAADGKVTAVYWATGPDGQAIEVLGNFTAAEAESFSFAPPKHYGTGTQLLPVLKYFTDGQQRPDLYEAKLGMYVFITDGQMKDIEAVKQYCTQLAHDIEAGRRNDLKLFIIGLGEQVDESQLDELDDLDTGTSIDLWDTRLASEMKELAEIFAEVVDDENVILVPNDGIVRDSAGRVIKDYRDSGLPGVLEFLLPTGDTAFSLEVGGNRITQSLV